VHKCRGQWRGNGLAGLATSLHRRRRARFPRDVSFPRASSGARARARARYCLRRTVNLQERELALDSGPLNFPQRADLACA